jgi:hypothetical protein
MGDHAVKGASHRLRHALDSMIRSMIIINQGKKGFYWHPINASIVLCVTPLDLFNLVKCP